MNKRAPRTSRSLSLVPQLKFPKEVNTYCPKCGHHTAHSVAVYKAGKARTMAWGTRRQERRKHGYWGQKFPELKRTSNKTKKSLLRIKYRTCNNTVMRLGIRLRKLQVGS